MVETMKQLSEHFAQTANDILTEDDGSGITISIIPPNTQSKNSINAHATQLENRIANIKTMAANRSGADDEAEPLAEMVIFSRYGYYQCAPYGKSKIIVGVNGPSPHLIATATAVCLPMVLQSG